MQKLNIGILTIIYCFAINFIALSPIYSSINGIQENESIEQLSAISAKISYHTSQSENYIYNFNNLPLTDLKFQDKEFWAINTISVEIIKSKLYKLYILSVKYLLKYSKIDIIFPFHYFW